MVDLITLNEAVNQMMGEPRRSPQQEIGRLVVYQNQLHRLAAKYSAEVAKLPEALHAKVFTDELGASPRPNSTPTPALWPPSDFIDRRGDRDSEWPWFLLEIYDAAANLSREISEYDRRYANALDRLLEAGRAGTITFYGRRAKGSKTEMIPHEHFLSNVTIDGDRRALVPSSRKRGTIPCYQLTPISSKVPTLRWSRLSEQKIRFLK